MRHVLMATLATLTLIGVGTLAAGSRPALAGTSPGSQTQDPLAGITDVTIGKSPGTAAKVCPQYPDKYSSCVPAAPPPSHTILVPVPLTVSCPGSAATAGTAYSSAITAGGGFSRYSRYAASSLPTGLSVNATTGAITGTPTTGGRTTTFTATVTDSEGLAGSATCSITVSVNGPVVIAVAGADVHFYSGSLSVNLSLTQTRADCGVPLNGGTCLRFAIFNDDTGEPVDIGYGMIPNSSVTFTASRITLNTDTSKNPSFVHVAGSGGVISLTWTATSSTAATVSQ